MSEKRYTEEPEHKHQDDHVFGKTASAQQEEAERRLDEADGQESEVEDDEIGGRTEPHAGGRAEPAE
jgi:hypothetical protein